MASAAERGRQVLAWMARAGRAAWPWLRWLLQLAAGLVWSVGYYALRWLEYSKRAWSLSGLIALVCALAAWRLGHRPDMALPLSVGLILIVVSMVAAHSGWAEYGRKLLFCAESQPASRDLLIDGDWYRSGRWSWPASLAPTLAVLLAAVLAWRAWPLLGAAAQTLAAGLACWLVAVMTGYLSVVLVVVERRVRVRYYVRGWRLADPAEVETWVLARVPLMAPVIAWRGRLAGTARSLRDGLGWLLRPRGSCTG